MIKKVLAFTALLILHIYIVGAQTNCNHEQFILSFLQKISSDHYKSSLTDFNFFFDSSSEIEVILRSDYIKEHPNAKLTFNSDSIGLAIEKLLTNKTMKHLIDLNSSIKNKWIISKANHELGATEIYIIGSENSNDRLFIQMVNWADQKRCGITDVLDSIGNSIYFVKEPDSRDK